MTTQAKTLDFGPLKIAVANQFNKLVKHQLFRTATPKDQMWETYLKSFPEGSDPIYKNKTEHDCNCCKSFIRTVGNVVAIIDGKKVSIWDITIAGEYQVVVDAMAALVKAQPIEDVFLHVEKQAGVDKTLQQIADGSVKSWRHFYVPLPDKYVVTNGESLGKALNEPRQTQAVMLRSLTELKMSAVDTVLELIAAKALYRGEEQKWAVSEFKKLKTAFDKLTTDEDREIFTWSKVADVKESVSRIRNTAAGTLLVDLSEGKDLESAVKAWETVMAPANYKRPKALATPSMIKEAEKTAQELGIIQDLERRMAKADDVRITNVLFADSGVKPVMLGNVFAELANEKATVKVKDFEQVQTMSIDDFLNKLLPTAQSIEILFESKHIPNLVNLIAPVYETENRLFKWDNGFSWAYKDGLADSDIRQAVQARGGSVTGVFRFSHSWNHAGRRNASLMDLHVFMPGSEIRAGNPKNDTYGNRERVGWNNRRHLASGAVQDVDYTEPAPDNYIPVENITFPDLRKMPEGTYVCKVHNWQLRQPTQGGFRCELEFGGNIYAYDYAPAMAHKEWVTVAEVTLKNGEFTIKHHLPETGGAVSSTEWGLKTQAFHKVKMVMFSPNHWDGQVGLGNKHYLFMLDGCKSEEPARGFLNEYLNQKLDAHRKVFELIGSRMMAPPTDDQLAGIGFSSTKPTSFVVRVTGKATRTVVKVTV